MTDALLDVRNLRKWFPLDNPLFRKSPRILKAVDDISFSIGRGEILGLVGESGSGKTTAGLSAVRLHEPTGGQILFDGHDLGAAGKKEMRQLRRRIQVIFQDPFASLNPRMRIGDAVAEPMIVHGLVRSGREARDKVAALLEKVGMQAQHASRFPHEFSGGQRQRIGIARALASEPELLVADEPTSALDVSVRAQIIELVAQLRDDLGLSMLFISHDLAVVGYLADRIGVLYLGRLIEIGAAQDVIERPLHPYTRMLLAAVPKISKGQGFAPPAVRGEIPSPVNPPSGCVFVSRCPHVVDACRQTRPSLRGLAGGRQVACIRDDVIGERAS